MEIKERIVAIQVRTYSASPNEVLMPAGERSESNACLTVLNMAMESAEAARRKTVARQEAMAPPMIHRGEKQLARSPNTGVRNVKMNASRYATPKNCDAEPYFDIALRKCDDNEPCMPVLSSCRSERGSKWKPNLGFEQIVESLLSAQ